MKNRRNYYRILNVQPDAPTEVIRSSYRTMMQRMGMHPDLGGDSHAAAMLNEAYETLMDAANRSAYDRMNREAEWAVHTRNARAANAAEHDSHRQCAFCAYRFSALPHEGAPSACANCASPLCPPASMGQTEAEDRRAIARLPRNLPLQFYTHWPQPDAWPGRADDVSPAGLRFQCATSLAQGQVVKVESALFSAIARIRSSTKDDHLWQVGAQFLSVSFARVRGSFVEYRA
ncbi:MAG: DnaJ domain-containing protein [Gammaproteobacteria bacterium]|nr:DnaJ domain-containing protein [Gammaproteobacteria bacterium]